MAKRDIGAEIIAGLNEIRDNPKALVRYKFAPANVRSARKRFGMTQGQFAEFLMISVRTLQKWEQGKRFPDGAAHALLRVMEREPDAVLRALHDPADRTR
mgnify:CR=1 FL=1